MENKIERVKELVQILNNASYYYYVENKPIMENREYNALYDELEELEQVTRVILSSSPTQRAGYPVVDSNLPKLKHDIPLLSLDKEKDVEGLKKWLGNKEGVLMLKIDGGTGKIEYNNYQSTRLSTRGGSDTNIGEVISHNINSIANLPKKISVNQSIQITGEMYMTFEDFNKINNAIVDEDKKYSNARNLANSTASISDSQICKNRNIKFKAFNIIKGIDFKTKVEQLEWLNSQGFDAVSYWIVNKDNLEEKIEEIKNNIPNIEYPIDGLVLSYNDLKYGLSLGNTSHHFRHSISFKFEDSFYQSIYDYTDWATSRTGQIVPTGIFQTTKIEGSNVSRATLSNISMFEILKLGHGDKIEVSKRNLIIPKIENNITRSNTEKIPNECPMCHGEVEIRQDKKAKVLYCLNPDCEAKFINKLSHFVSKKCFNIEGLSKQSLLQLSDNGLINDVMDIFKLDDRKKEIVRLDGWGLPSYIKMIDAIENSKTIKIENFITALQIDKIGFSKSKDIVNFLGLETKENILSLLNISATELLRKKNFGEKTNQNIVSYFNDEDNIKVIKQLLDIVEFEKEEQTQSQGKDLTGLIFVITGSVINFKNRDEIKALIESRNGRVSGSVSSKTNFLINNDIESTSGKNLTARKLNIPILNENDFLELIK